MAEADDWIAVEEILQQLEGISFVAHRDTKLALPAIRPLGAAATRYWIEAGRDLFQHDREAGKSFLRHSAQLAEATGTVTFWTAQAREFLRWVNAYAVQDAFLRQAAQVWRAWGEPGEVAWFQHGLHWCERSLPDARAYFEAPYDHLAGEGGVDGLQALLEPAETLYLQRRLSLECYLAGATSARRIVGTTGLLSWARRGADLLAAGRSRGEAYFRMESEEGMRLLLDAVPGYRGRLHGRFLGFLLRAWLDAEVPLADSAWRPGDGRPMLETDGRRLYLPAVFGSRDEAIIAVEHAAGHLAYDTYAQPLLEALFARAGSSHPPLDDQGRMTWRPLFARFGSRMIRFQVLFDLAEDLRVNARLHQRIPGFLSRLLRLAEACPQPLAPAQSYFRWALSAHRALENGTDPGHGLAVLLAPDASLLDSWRVAEELFGQPEWPEIGLSERSDAYLPGLSLNAARPIYPQPVRAGVLADFRDVGDAHEQHRFEKEKQEEAPEQTPEGAQKDPDADIQLPPERTSGSGGRIGVGIPAPAQVSRQSVAWAPRSDAIPYPEWDYREQRQLSDWVNLRERILEEQNGAAAAAILAQHGSALRQLTRALELQRPMRLAPLRRQLDGEELDTTAVVDFVADKRVGLSPQPYIYRRRAVQHRDTAVLLLADLSTSIMARHPSGEGKIVERIRSGLMLFAEALARIGDPCAIAGFASKQRDQVHYYWLKDFADPLDDTVRGRIAGISGRLASRMGAAIRHSLQAMQRVGNRHRLLLILSDGRPADYDDGGDARYLREDTRMAMKEAQDAGVHPFCITLDSSGQDYLPQIFGPGHYTLIDRVDELPRRLPEIYLRLRR